MTKRIPRADSGSKDGAISWRKPNGWTSARATMAVLLFCLAAVNLPARDYFVATTGRDENPGTSAERPFRTISRAAAVLQPGDTCWIRAGVYRETIKVTRSGDKGNPIVFASFKAERVIVDGSDVVASPWTRDEGNIWRARLDVNGPIEALFRDGRMMVEARWPNCAWEDNWQADRKWAVTGKGSGLGRIECASLAESGQDLSAGLLYIKLSKGNNCFTRPVTRHHAGAASLEYDRTGIEGRAWNEDSMPERIKKYGFKNNRFFVAARGALDAPGEWWFDAKRSELLFITPDGGDPALHEVSVKTRVSGFEGEGASDVTIEGLEFRGCNVRFDKSRRITLRDCRFLYPSTPKVFPDGKTALEMEKNIRVAGDENVLERLLVEWAVDGALEVEGAGNRVEDCVVHDCNLHGRHPGPGIIVRGSGGTTGTLARPANIVRRCTVHNAGGVGIYALGQATTVEYNHVFNAGLYCVDVSSLYLPIGGNMEGSTVHHNWLHDIHGIGFRVDTQGRGITFHHNLVWNASSGCKLQGFQLAAYNNTVLVNAPKSAFMVVFEPEATPGERAGWRVRNNVAYAFLDRLSLRSDYKNAGRPLMLPLKPENGVIDHNVKVPPGEETRFFVDPANYDFRPRPGGPIDAEGVAIEGIAEGVDGRPPSAGACQTGEKSWKVGASWMNDDLPVPASEREATDLARRLRPVSLRTGLIDRQYKKQ